jgi:hypothetical protein
MISFKFIEKITANFTPSTKIFQYAKKNGFNCYRTQYGTQVLETPEGTYTYDHYTLTDNGDGTETVEIFLRLF